VENRPTVAGLFLQGSFCKNKLTLVSFSVPAPAGSDTSAELRGGRAGASSNVISSTRDGAASNACIPASVEGSVVKDLL